MTFIDGKRIRLCHRRNLIFFVCILFACSQQAPTNIEIVWEGQQAVGVSVPTSMIEATDKPISDVLQLRIKSDKPVRMLGNIEDDGSRVIFRPLVPLTRGMHYEILVNDNLIGGITVPLAETSQATVQVYPSLDTVPENLLKVYLKFSKPMQEGKALEHIALLNNNGDTMRGVFLDLKQELWNAKRDMLTLWLDPGRIKRGLHPNQDFGQPLSNGQRYTLIISPNWKDTDGISLLSRHEKVYSVSLRDSLKPDASRWRILPPSTTTDGLRVSFGEPLDFALVHAALHVVDASGSELQGVWTSGPKELSACFMPENAWVTGSYSVQIEPRIEDLAGNNLNRAFETAITAGKIKPSDTLSVVSRKFEVRD